MKEVSFVKQIRDLEQKIFEEREDYKDMYANLVEENSKLKKENKILKMCLYNQLKSTMIIT